MGTGLPQGRFGTSRVFNRSKSKIVDPRGPQQHPRHPTRVPNPIWLVNSVNLAKCPVFSRPLRITLTDSAMSVGEMKRKTWLGTTLGIGHLGTQFCQTSALVASDHRAREAEPTPRQR